MHDIIDSISGTGYIASMYNPTAKAITEIKNKRSVYPSDKTLLRSPPYHFKPQSTPQVNKPLD